MKLLTIPLAAVAFMLLSACATSQGSPNNAACSNVIPTSSLDEGGAREEERVWLEKHFPGYLLEFFFDPRIEPKNCLIGAVRGSYTINCGDRAVEVVEILLPDGKRKKVYFDITQAYGRY